MSYFHDYLPDPPEKEARKENGGEASLQKRGENVAFAVESVLTCFATDFIDPVVSHWFQREHARQHALEQHGTLAQNVIGEVGGDVFSAIALIAAEEVFPKNMRKLSHELGEMLDPVYSVLAEKAVDDKIQGPERTKKMEEWKDYQKDNVAKTIVMSVAGIGGNVALQKSPWLANPSPTSVILKGKLMGAAVTAGLVVGSRLMWPKQTKQIDAWLSKNVFSPIIAKIDPEHDEEKEHHHAKRIRGERGEGMAATAPAY
jgi:hypothetical protein